MQSQHDISTVQEQSNKLEKLADQLNEKLKDNTQDKQKLLEEAKQVRADINKAMQLLRSMAASNQELKDTITNLHTRLVKSELAIGSSITTLQLELYSPDLSSSRSTNTPNSAASASSDNDMTSENGLLSETKMTVTLSSKSKKEIHKQEVSLAELYDDMAGTDDHFSYSGTVNNYLGFAEEHGKRETQEDRLAFGSIAKFAELTEDEKKDAISNTIDMLEKNTGMPKQGSTLCMTIVCGDTLYTSHLGDSFSWLVTQSENGQSAKLTRLNRGLHTGHAPSEKIRLEFANKLDYLIKHENYRLYNPESGCYLAMTRSIGDRDMEKCGLSHDPTSYIDKLVIPRKGKVKLILACDGVEESLAETKALGKQTKRLSIEEIIEQHPTLSTGELAELITSTALKEGSEDNISAIVIDLSEWHKTNASLSIYACVFDGHGGHECADNLRKQFHSTLAAQIELTLAQRKTVTEEPPAAPSGPRM